jgi:hypothetical protein
MSKQSTKSQTTPPISSSGKSKSQKLKANERGEFISYLAKNKMPVARANALIKTGMSREEVAAALIEELR